MTDYVVMMHSIPIKPDTADLSDTDLAKVMSAALAQFLGGIKRDMDAQNLKGWQLLSHNLTRLSSHLLFSVLVQVHN